MDHLVSPRSHHPKSKNTPRGLLEARERDDPQLLMSWDGWLTQFELLDENRLTGLWCLRFGEWFDPSLDRKEASGTKDTPAAGVTSLAPKGLLKIKRLTRSCTCNATEPIGASGRQGNRSYGY